MLRKFIPHKYLKNGFINGRILENIFWLLLDKFLRLGLGAAVVILMARYLGPDKFGLFNYTAALIALFGAFSALGLNAIVTRDLVTRDNKGDILGTSLGLRLVSSMISYVALIFCMYFLREDQEVAQYLALIMGMSLLFKSSDVVKFWFESQISSKYTVFIENGFFFVIAALKIILIYLKAPLILFGVAVLIESILVCVGLFWIYIRNGANQRWVFRFSQAKYLLSQSWPLIISSSAWIIYTKIDQIMIGQLLDDNQVGLYTAASKLSEIANFFPAVITFSFVPAILKIKDIDVRKYNKQFQNVYYLVVTLMVMLAIVVTSFSTHIINILYGNQYIGSEVVLSIHFWIVVLVALATISGRYLVNDNLQKFTMKRHILGVLLNVPLNYMAIPIYGINGAAYASLLSLFVANYVFDFFDKETRIVFKHKSKAMVFFWVFELLGGKKNGS